jgi:hypothetical protein
MRASKEDIHLTGFYGKARFIWLTVACFPYILITLLTHADYIAGKVHIDERSYGHFVHGSLPSRPLILNAREHCMVQWRLFRGLVIMCAVWKYILLFPGNFSAVSTCWKVPLKKKPCSMHYLHEYYMHALCKTWLYWAGSLKDDWSLPRRSKPVSDKRDLSQTNEQQRHFNE